MRILVTGSRDWTDGSTIRVVLASLADRNRTAILVHGDCRGADWIARDIWRTA